MTIRGGPSPSTVKVKLVTRKLFFRGLKKDKWLRLILDMTKHIEGNVSVVGHPSCLVKTIHEKRDFQRLYVD